MYLCKILCAPTPVCKGAHRCVRVCVCVSRPELPDGCYLRESDGQGKLARHTDRLKCLFSPESSIRPEENLSCCSTFLVPVRWGRGEGYPFLFAIDISIHTHLCAADW